MRRAPVFFLVVAFGVGIDLCSKDLVFRALEPGQAQRVIPGVLHFVRAQNEGVAFSLFAGKQGFILSFSLLAIVAMLGVYWRYRQKLTAWLLTALALVLTGAIGNVIDRVRLGYVRDFIDFVPNLPLVGHWPVFNVADMCISVGVAIIFVTSIFAREDAQSDGVKTV